MTADLAPTTTEPEPHSTGGEIRFDVFATLVLYPIAFALGAVSRVQTDLWWLLRAGKDFWHSGHVSLVESYSHTADGRSWPNHEWGWEAVAFALHHLGGMPLLSAWTGVTAAVTLWLVRLATQATGYIVPLILGGSMVLLSISWTTRPQATSMLLFALVVVLLVRERWAWLPVVFLVWANLHAQVVLGVVLLGAALGAAVIEYFWAPSDITRRRAARLGLSTVACALATLVNPLGPHLWTYTLSANGRPGQHRIAEWSTAFHPLISNYLFWALLATLCALTVRRFDRLRSWCTGVPALAVLVLAPLAVVAVRNIPLFVVVATPLLVTLAEPRTARPVGGVRHWRLDLGGAGAVAAAAVVLVWLAAPPRLGWRPVSEQLASALQACPGPLYNDYNEGAALIWWVPQVKVFVDNRQDPYPAAVIDASVGLTAQTYPAAFQRWHIGCAYLRRGTPLDKALHADSWTSTYSDDRSVVREPPSSPRATGVSE